MTTWILVADAARARLFSAERRNGHLTEVAAMVHPASRTFGHNTPERETSHTKVADEFSHALAELLEEGRVEHQYDQLILVAPPKFLGRMRSAISGEVEKLVAESVGKDVTRASPDEIREVLSDLP